MKTNRLITIMIALIFCCMFSAAGCGRNMESEDMMSSDWEEDAYWDGDNARYLKVSEDLSAYGILDPLLAMEDEEPRFFLDEAGTTEVSLDYDNYEDGKYILKVPSDTRDLYVQPSKIALEQELEEQMISLDQDVPIQTDYFKVAEARIPMLTDWSQRNYDSSEGISVRIYLVSETEQYPEYLPLVLDGKYYDSRGFGADIRNDHIMYRYYTYFLPDLYTAAMAIKYGTLHYSKLMSFVNAEKAVYQCEDNNVTIHILK